MTTHRWPLCDWPLRVRYPSRPLGAALAVIALLAVVVVPTSTAVSAEDTPDGEASEFAVIAEAIAVAPRLSFTDDGRPVIFYRDLDPFEELVDPDGERIPDQLGARGYVAVCGDQDCSEPPPTVTRLPLRGDKAFGLVVGRNAIFASEQVPATFSICDVETCLGGLVTVNLADVVGDEVVVRDMVRGTDESHHIVLSDDDTNTTSLARCSLVNCRSSDAQSFPGSARGVSLTAGGSPILALVDPDGSVAVLACSNPICVGDVPTSGVTTGTQALASAGTSGPIVAALQADGSLRVVRCIDPACSGPSNEIELRPAPGSRFTELVDLVTVASGAAAISVVEADGDSQQRSRVIVVDASGENTELLTVPGASRVDLARAPSGVLHLATDRAFALRDDGRPAYEQMRIEHTSCDIACQCKVSSCQPRPIEEVCITESNPYDAAWLAATGLAVVDLSLGDVAGPGPNLYLGTDASEEFRVSPLDVVCGSGGDDRILFVGPEGDPPPVAPAWAQAFGGEGNDIIDMSSLSGGYARGDAGADIVLGSPGDDDVAGGSGDDLVVGGGGDDRLNGGLGSDRMWGGPGNDVVNGDLGADRLRGGPGNDTIRGAGLATQGDASDNDDIAGGSGRDIIFGHDGVDTIRGGTGDDLIYAGDGDDELANGNGGRDIVVGGRGDDVLLAGGPRPDTVQGGEGNDVVKGNGGADTLGGGPGDDEIFGGPQPDTIVGGDGADACTGGTEPDTFDSCETVTE